MLVASVGECLHEGEQGIDALIIEGSPGCLHFMLNSWAEPYLEFDGKLRGEGVTPFADVVFITRPLKCDDGVFHQFVGDCGQVALFGKAKFFGIFRGEWPLCSPSAEFRQIAVERKRVKV